jgi:hypothetical protein
MFNSSWFPWSRARQHKGLSRGARATTLRRRSIRLAFDHLEDRTVPSNFTAATISELIADINAANALGGSNTISLVSGNTFTLTAAQNTTDVGNGLPVIAANDNLTIQGDGDTIARSTASGTPAFRFFDVAPGAALTLENLTLSNGLVIGGTGMTAYGGAIFNEAGGSLRVSYTTFTANHAIGGDGGQYAGGLGIGGAVKNDGAAKFDHDFFSGNQAVGGATSGQGEQPNTVYGPVYGTAFGGAIANGTLGTLRVSWSLFTGNQAIGGLRHSLSSIYDGLGASGAIDNWNSATVTDTNFTSNQAIGGAADKDVNGGLGIGGALGSGGPFAPYGVMTIRRCAFSDNQAIGADAGAGKYTPDLT